MGAGAAEPPWSWSRWILANWILVTWILVN
jgi:hypothetical protein